LNLGLKDRVAIVTGASVGIGRACAAELLAEGAHVVAASKDPTRNAEASRKLSGKGGRVLGVPFDIESDDSVHLMVERTVAEFGRLDILVNNAGAIWAQPILETPPKRFDLMMGINVRAAYIASYYALPHMRKQRWGHILNMCPRLSNAPSPGKVAYMISKLGMARLAIGLAAEHQADNIAANSLWPRTIIESQASINWGMADRSQWRTPEILCDASLAIFAQEPRACTGRQWIDEEALAELAGITNFDHYWCEGRPPSNPVYIDNW